MNRTWTAVPFRIAWFEDQPVATLRGGANADYSCGAMDPAPRLPTFKGRLGAQAYDYAAYWIERVPVYRADCALRAGIKRVIGFRDA
jgi:hypothetical protein